MGDRPRYYVLRGREIVPATADEAWGAHKPPNNRVLRDERGDVTVSTVFLWLDHRMSKDGPPILFETMVFGGPHDEDMERCSTYDEAEAQHARICAQVFGDPT